MTVMRMTMAGVALALLGAAACSVQAPATAGDGVPATTRTATLQPFGSEAALRKQLRAWRAELEREQRRVAREQAVFAPPAPAAPTAAAESVADAAAAPEKADAAAADGESITNVQTAGVDEGGIVKRVGDHLVVLRRGRLFTVRIGDDDLRPVSMVDAFGPGIDPDGAWYDEMLVSRNTIVVIGYSYQRGGTELGLFDLARDGTITYRSTYHLRSNDYYSSRNYASRLVGDQLVFYSPLFVDLFADDIDDVMPGVRKWQPGMARGADFTRILPAERVYRPAREMSYKGGLALHTVTSCDLSTPELQCRATAVLGRPGNTFYVSGDAAYVWTNGWDDEEDGRPRPRTADVFRIPLDGSAPGALQAEGAPIDQMSFLERDGHLNVLVSALGRGQWMWGAERNPGEVALMRVPLAMFADGRDVAGPAHYRRLPDVGREGALQNRYVGDWLLFGIGETWRGESPGVVHAVRYASDAGFRRVQVGHAIGRIEALGRDALVVGNAGRDLRYTSLRLGDAPAIASVWVQPDAVQGESRTHGFFYRPVDATSGFIGLPTLGRNARGEPSAAVQFLHTRALALTPAGALEARGVLRGDDGCQASCVDWYGNARPIFIGERVFALMGYELVEGRYEGLRVRERRRVDFTPATIAPVSN